MDFSILISSPGRCGTHWLARILRKVYKLEQRPTMRWNEPEMIEMAENVPVNKLYISHDPPQYFIPALNSGLRCVAIVRDPRDIIVSAAHYWSKKSPEDRRRLRVYWESGIDDDADFDKILRCLKFRMHNYRWFKWYVDSSKIDDGLVRYEDLHEDTFTAIALLSLRLGLTIDENAIDKAIYEARFEKVKDGVMYRRGIVGEWKEYFTDEENKLFLKRYSWIMDRLGYDV